MLVALPDLVWGVGGQLRPARYPAGWEKVSQIVTADGGDVAVLPAGMFRVFDFSGPCRCSIRPRACCAPTSCRPEPDRRRGQCRRGGSPRGGRRNPAVVRRGSECARRPRGGLGARRARHTGRIGRREEHARSRRTRLSRRRSEPVPGGGGHLDPVTPSRPGDRGARGVATGTGRRRWLRARAAGRRASTARRRAGTVLRRCARRS